MKPAPSDTNCFSTCTTLRPFLPATPVTACLSALRRDTGTISVPSSSGQLVLSILMGMPASLTGRAASACITLAPM